MQKEEQDAISEIINQHLADSGIVRTPWIVNAIMMKWSDISGEDADRYRNWSHVAITKEIRSQLKKFQVMVGNADEQLTLDGFDHVQKAYTIERDGEPTLVRIDLCSDGELLARADELDRMATTCQSHALELRQYVAIRGTNRASV